MVTSPTCSTSWRRNPYVPIVCLEDPSPDYPNQLIVLGENMKKNTSYTLLITTVLIAASLLLSACGPSANPDGSVNVEVTLTDFGIESSLDTFEVGVPYHFIVTNEGAVNHEIMIMQPMMADMEMSMEEMDAMALAYIEEDELTPGTTQTLDYTFTEPAPAGSLELGCHIEGHYEAGMKLPITVQ
jgi:uncharacterized cupredoxin-like copper-binding protein